MTELLKTDLYRLIEARHGRFLANPKDIYLGRSMIKYGEFSELEWQVFDQMLRPGAVVVEVGANMGAFTVPIANKVGRGGMVYAFEPQLSVFQQLCANLALNDLVNVQAFNAGCGAEAGWLTLKRPDPARELNFGGLSLDALTGSGGVRVRVETLDEVLDLEALHMLKADVEGMEAQVIRGARGLIEKLRPILYLEAHDPEDSPELIRLVGELDYDMYWHLPAMFNPKNHSGDTENIFGVISSKNMLCVPSERNTTVHGARRVADENDHPRKWGQ
ncbi:MAG: FkbM family methyltransferase [Pseudomonadota bacterium]